MCELRKLNHLSPKNLGTSGLGVLISVPFSGFTSKSGVLLCGKFVEKLLISKNKDLILAEIYLYCIILTVKTISIPFGI